MAKLDTYFNSYKEYHRTKGNKIAHYVGIPLIVFSTLGLLALVRTGWFDLGFAVWLISTLFYCRLDIKRGFPFSIVTFAMYWSSLWVPMNFHWSLFVGGWIIQGIGHYVYEKRSPAFLTNLTHLLIGPFWIYCQFAGTSRK